MRVALVTGGTQGIGWAIARRLASEGFALGICGRRSEDAVGPALSVLRELGTQVLYLRADLGASQARTDLVKKVRAELGGLHVLVNNAGMAPRERKDILEATEESYLDVMRTNLQGPFFLTQACARWMIEQKEHDPAWSGCIVNISSTSASIASVSRGEYCLSKAGVSMATKLWAARLGEFDIPVFEVRPGIIRTDMTAPVTQRYDDLIDNGLTVQRRWGTPDDVASAVAAFVRGDFPYSTGQYVEVDGGLTLQRL